MNEELQKQLANIIGGITQAVAKGADFAMAQLPDVAQQYVAYGRAAYTAWMLLAIVLCVVAARLFKEGCRISKEAKGYYDPRGEGYFAASAGLALLAFITAGLSLHRFMLVWLAPKIYVLQGLADLLK